MATPDTIANLDAWWKADSLALADGALVATWADSGSGGHAASSTNKPIYKASIVNGKPVLRFNGTTNYLTSNASASLPAQTIFAVVSAVSSPGATIRGASASGGLQYRLSYLKPGILSQYVADLGGSTSPVTASTFTVVAVSWANATSSAHYLNGAANGGVAQTASLTAGTTTNIGRNGSGANEFYNGDLAELIVYSRVLIASERATVDSYLSDKYAITVADYVPPASPVKAGQFFPFFV